MNFCTVFTVIISVLTVFFDAEEAIAFCINPTIARALSWALIICLLVILPKILLELKAFFLSQGKYVMPLFLVISAKFILIWFFYPEMYSKPYHCQTLIRFTVDFFLLLAILSIIRSVRQIRLAILSYGLGAAVIILMIMLYSPELIGQRESLVDDFIIAGSIWNIAVISLIAVGWYLVMILLDSDSKIIFRVLAGLSLSVIFLGGILGLSRTVIFASFVSLFFFALIWRKAKIWVVASCIILCVIILASMQSFTPVHNLGQRISETRVSEESRIVIWKEYLEKIPDYLLFGSGIKEHKGYYEHESGRGPHSAFLNYFVQFGLFGFFAFIWLIYGIFKQILKLKYSLNRHCLLSWLVFYLAVAFINETGFYQASVFWGIAIAFAISMIWKRIQV